MVVSNNQSGGVTSKVNHHTSFINEHKKTLAGAVALIASCVGVLDYFNINPFKKMAEGNQNPINIQDISGDVTVSNNQSGGVTAHTVNITTGLHKRTLTEKKSYIIQELKKKPIAAYRLYYSPNDPEINAFASEINQILTESGWKEISPIKIMAGTSLPPGVTVVVLKPEEPMVTLIDQVWNALGHQGVTGQILPDVENVFTVRGWPPVELPQGMNGTVIFIGPNPLN